MCRGGGLYNNKVGDQVCACLQTVELSVNVEILDSRDSSVK